MSDDFGLSPVQFSRLARRGVLFGLSPTQLCATGAALLLFVGCLYTGRLDVLVLSAPLWGAAVAASFVPVAGRRAIDWAPTVGNWFLRRVGGQTRYRRRIEGPAAAGSLRLPGDAARLRQYSDPVSGAVMVHDPREHTLTAIVTVTHSAFVLQDPLAQQRRVDGFSRVLATACRSGRIARLQVLERTLPESGAGLADWWAKHGSFGDDFAVRTYRSLIERAGPAAERHATTISLALDMTRSARSIRAAGGGVAGAATVLRQEMDTLSAALRSADLRSSQWCTADELAGMLLTSYDPHSGGARHLDDFSRSTGSAGPVAVDEYWDRLRSDSAHHAVLWISEWPRAAVFPGFLAPLMLSSGVRRTISITYTPLESERAVREIRRRKTEHVADSVGRARFGQLDDARQSAEYGDVLQQEADLAAGHGILRYTGLITVSADTSDQLETSIAAIEQAAIQASCETRRLVGQQAAGFTAGALPLARSL